MEKDITISDIAIHSKNKKEVYHVLTIEGELYLPPIIDANKNYIQSIMRGFKKFLYSKNVKVVKAPHIDKLSIKEIIAWRRGNTSIDSYLPTCSYDKYPNRDWLCNVLNTIAYDKFQTLIMDALKSRERKLVKKSKLNVVAIPEIIKIFAKSQKVSISKCKSHFLMRDCQLERKHKHPDEEMKDEVNQSAKANELQKTIKSLEFKIDEYEKRQDDFLSDRGKFVKLIEEGYINSDGEHIEK